MIGGVPVPMATPFVDARRSSWFRDRLELPVPSRDTQHFRRADIDPYARRDLEHVTTPCWR
jgi:hypothetical protein